MSAAARLVGTTALNGTQWHPLSETPVNAAPVGCQRVPTRAGVPWSSEVAPHANRVDVAALLAGVDLEAVVAADVDLRGLPGRELHGPCPFCVCTSQEPPHQHRCDRFRLSKDRQRWFCRHCQPKGGNAIDYVMQRDGLTFREACDALSGGALHVYRKSAGCCGINGPVPAPAVEPPVPEPPPVPAWQGRAEVFAATCEAALWSDGGEVAREWLHARGLRDDTLRGWRIGYHGHDAAERWEARAAWGLEGARSMALPRGIVIPWLDEDGGVWGLKVRRHTADVTTDKPKYHAVAGSVLELLYGHQTVRSHAPGVLLESELDVLLLAQEADDLCAAVTANGARSNFSLRQLWVLRKCVPIHVAYDADDAGQRAAAALRAKGPRYRPVPWPEGVKDLGDFHRGGHDVRTWAAALLGVSLVACARCGTVAPAFYTLGDGRGVCQPCYEGVQ